MLFRLKVVELFMDIISKAANKKMLLTRVPTCNFHMQLVRYLSDVEVSGPD